MGSSIQITPQVHHHEAVFGIFADRSRTCSNGKACKKAVPNFLELKSSECQCRDGVCPPGQEFNGKVPCASSWNIPDFFRGLFMPLDYAENPIYNKNKINHLAL